MNRRAKPDAGSAMPEYVPMAALILAAAVLGASLHGNGLSAPVKVQALIFAAAFLVGFGALLVLALRATWIVTVSPKRVVVMKSPLVSLFFVTWAALFPIGLYGLSAVNTVHYLNSHAHLFFPLSWLFIILGAAGFIAVNRAIPVALICNPEARTYKYISGTPPMAYVRRGGLYDMLGIRVDEEGNRFVVRVSWRARRWKIDFGSFIDREKANALGRKVAKGIGTSCWPAN